MATCRAHVTQPVRRHAQRLEHRLDPAGVPDLASDGEALRQVPHRLGIPAHAGVELSRVEQRTAPGQRALLGARARERLDDEPMGESREPAT